MHAPNGPLSGALKAAADALATGKLKTAHDVISPEFCEDYITVRGLEGREWVIAGHISETDTAAHRVRCDVRRLGTAHVTTELFSGFVFVDVHSHGFSLVGVS